MNLATLEVTCLGLELTHVFGLPPVIRIARHVGLPLLKSQVTTGSNSFNKLEYCKSGVDPYEQGMLYSYGERTVCWTWSGKNDCNRSQSGVKSGRKPFFW